MPLNLDSCIAGVFTPGNIPASSGLPPVQPIVPSFGPAPVIAETAAATDALDYFMGEQLYEAASATDSYTATGGAYELAISEAAAAVDAIYLPQTYDVAVGEVSGATADNPSVHVPGIVSASVAETATATDAPDATVAMVPTATFDGTATANITMSNGNLTATVTASGATNAGVVSTAAKSTGKYYFEVTYHAVHGGASTNAGIIIQGRPVTDFASGANVTSAFASTGDILSNDGFDGRSLGAFAANDVICFAIDLNARLAWLRRNSANWNGDAAANPATGTNGAIVEAGTFVPGLRFGGSGAVAGDALTANFGATAFAQTVPSGFTAGWTA